MSVDPYRDSPFTNELHQKDEIILLQNEQLHFQNKQLNERDKRLEAKVLETSRLRERLAGFEKVYCVAKCSALAIVGTIALNYGAQSLSWDVHAIDSDAMGGSSSYSQPMFDTSASSSYMYDIEIDVVNESCQACVDPFVAPRPVRGPFKGHPTNLRNDVEFLSYPKRPLKTASASWPMPTATVKPPLVLVEYSLPSCPP